MANSLRKGWGRQRLREGPRRRDQPSRRPHQQKAVTGWGPAIPQVGLGSRVRHGERGLACLGGTDPSSQTALKVQSWHHRTRATPSTHTCPPHMRLRNSTQDQRRRTGPPRCPAMMQPPQDPPVATPAAYAGAAAAAAPGTKNGSELGRLLGKANCNPSPAVKFALHQALRKYKAGHSPLTS